MSRHPHRLALGLLLLLLAAPTAAAAQTPSSPPPLPPVQTAQQPAASPAHERLAEVRIHGNYTTPDDAVLRLGGLAIGQPLTATAPEDVAGRLRASGRFQSVEVRKRYRTLAPSDQVVLIVIVREYPSASDVDITPPGPLSRLKERLMFLPILSYADGYGFTYGGRASFVHLLGRDGRVSVPLTWGGMKRAAVEVEKGFSGGPISRVDGGLSISRRENPLYRIDDDRQEVWVHADRALLSALRVGGGVGWTGVRFGALDESFVRYGLDVTLDTRQDPVFPRNAVYARAGWDTLDFSDRGVVHRTSLEGRGYLGLFRQNVLSVRARYDQADAPLPPYEQFLLGGASTLRGFRAGSFAGDTRFVSSVELRMPFTTPLKTAKTGIALFFDSGAAYNRGRRLRDVDLRHGVGAGFFSSLAMLQLNLDVAYGLKGDEIAPPIDGRRDGGRWRVHLMSGFQF